MPRRKRLGRARCMNLRHVVEAILYIVATGASVAATAVAIPAPHDRAGIFLPLDPWRAIGGAEQRTMVSGADGGG